MAFPSLFSRRQKAALNVPINHVLGNDTELHGRLVFSGGLSVEGRVEGDLQANGSDSAIVVSKGARVITPLLKADTLLIHGEVQAERIQAKCVVLTATSKVSGAIDAGAIEIHQGARFEGQVVTRGEVATATPVASTAHISASGEGRTSSSIAKERLEGVTGRSRATAEAN